jgi:hypothetical protein
MATALDETTAAKSDYSQVNKKKLYGGIDKKERADVR